MNKTADQVIKEYVEETPKAEVDRVRIALGKIAKGERLTGVDLIPKK